MRAPSPWLDRIGATVSAACGIHCAALGAVFLIWPSMWLQRARFGDSLVWLLMLEVVLALLALTIAVFAFTRGWRRHRRWWPVVLALLGLSLIGIGVFSPTHDIPLWGNAIVLCGGIVMVVAHWRNLRLLRAAPTAA